MNENVIIFLVSSSEIVSLTEICHKVIAYAQIKMLC